VALRRGFHGRSNQTRSKRATTWTVAPNAIDMAFSTSSQQIWTNGVVLVTEDKATIVRVRGEMGFFLRSLTALGDGFRVACGLCLVTDQAFAIGSTAVPGPISELDWDGWLWHRFFDIRGVTATIADGVNAGAVQLRVPIDSKAMRKWDEGMTLIGVTEVVISGTAVLEQQGDARLLAKLT